MLELKNIDLKRNGKRLLQGIRLRFEPGRLYGVLGPNGAGKTSLLSCINGSYQPCSGQVLWQQADLLGMERAKISQTVAMVPQSPQSNFAFNVWEIVAMGRYPVDRMQANPLAKVQIEAALQAVDAYHLRHASVNEISSGERQRVYIARSLVTESPIMLLDEPTANLDIAHQLEVWSLLRRLVQKNRTIIVATHDLNMAERFCDGVAIIKKGRCLAAGPYANVMSSSILEDVFGVTCVHDENVLSYELPLRVIPKSESVYA